MPHSPLQKVLGESATMMEVRTCFISAAEKQANSTIELQKWKSHEKRDRLLVSKVVFSCLESINVVQTLCRP